VAHPQGPDLVSERMSEQVSSASPRARFLARGNKPLVLSPAILVRTLVIVVPVVVAFLLARPLVGAPLGTLGIIVGVVVAIVLLLRVQWVALLFVAVEPFEDYVRAISSSAVKGLGALLILSWVIHVAFPDLGARGVRTFPRPARRSGLGHPVGLAGIAMIAVVLAATVLHSNGSAGAEVLTRYLSFLGALIVLVDLMYEDLPVRRVVTVFVTSCAASGAIGLLNFIGGSLRVGGPIGDPNDFAFFMVAALPLALVLRRSARRPILWDLAAVLIAGAAAGTLSRGALAAVVAMLIYAVLAGVIRARVIGAILAALVVLFAVVAATDPHLIETSLAQKTFVAAQNTEDRLIRWRVTAEMTVDYPVLGIGPGGFKTNYEHYVDPAAVDVLHPLDVAHETYLEVSAELGLVGLAVFLAILAYGYAGARRRSQQPGPHQALAGGVCAAMIGSGVAAVFLTEQYYLPLWLLAACGAALDPRRGDEVRLMTEENRTISLQKGTR
jgi:putative inorganic carbon (hco3(-)) transporter